MKIKVLITGSTGMVGKGVLLECLEHPDVEKIGLLNRRPCGLTHPKIDETLISDFMDLEGVRSRLTGYDACYFCLGVSSVGMSEEAYDKVTFQLTMNLARILHEQNPGMVFCYVSGAGTDSTEKGRTMWARVKGKTENQLMKMGFRDVYAFRPGLILPEKGIRSRTRWYQAAYTVLRPFFPLLKRMNSVTSTSRVGKAMIAVTLKSSPLKILENRDINNLAKN